jgi:hypothetical protein
MEVQFSRLTKGRYRMQNLRTRRTMDARQIPSAAAGYFFYFGA